MNYDQVPIMYATATKACETFNLRSMLFLDISNLSNKLLKFAGFKKTMRNYTFCIYISTHPLVFILPNKRRKTETSQKPEIYRVNIYFFTILQYCFWQLLYFKFLRHTHTLRSFFFLYVSVNFLHVSLLRYVCLIFAQIFI